MEWCAFKVWQSQMFCLVLPFFFSCLYSICQIPSRANCSGSISTRGSPALRDLNCTYHKRDSIWSRNWPPKAVCVKHLNYTDLPLHDVQIMCAKRKKVKLTNYNHILILLHFHKYIFRLLKKQQPICFNFLYKWYHIDHSYLKHISHGNRFQFLSKSHHIAWSTL